jgi:hypothetical protein
MNADIRRAIGPGIAAAVGALLIAGHACAAVQLEQLIEARDLVCDFYNVDDWATAEARFALRDRADMLMVIENIRGDPETARVVHSHATGKRGLRRYVGETGVHFVEDRQGSVVVTTLLACEDWRQKRDRKVCARYSAQNAWHFDRSVHLDPDKAFRNLAAGSYRGVCEPWNPN